MAVSVDTWRAPVARAALAAGAAMVNDVSGLSDPELADACAETGAALVITHTRVAAQGQGLSPTTTTWSSDVLAFLRERAARGARARGVAEEQLVLDPGIDLAKTPAESVRCCVALPNCDELGPPAAARASRARTSSARSPGAAGRARRRHARRGRAGRWTAGPTILRVHDVADARDYLAVRAALRGEGEPSREDLRLDRGPCGGSAA